MQVNPYNNALDRLQADKKAAVGRIAELSRQLDWYRDFKPEATHARRLGIGRTLADHAAQQADDAVRDPGTRIESGLGLFLGGALGRPQVLQALAHSRQLAAAQGNRAAIHRACERALGDGRPGKVKSALKGKLEPVKREMGKLEARIADEVRKSQLDVREVIIDGSNMAHCGGDFIGLQALEAVVPVLAAKCAVTINFDPGFRRKIGLGSADVRARFPQANVYFAPHGMKADPFVLKHGDGKPHAYVISNDKFSEFLDKEVVQQGRILKHAVMNNAAQIPDLDISVPLAHA